MYVFFNCINLLLPYLLEFVIYDNGCHLKRFATSNKRNELTPTAERLASLNFVVDRFHFSGHTDPWCKKNCNPDSFEALKKVYIKYVVTCHGSLI